MSREIYYSELTIDLKEDLDIDTGDSYDNRTSFHLEKPRICIFDEQSDTTEHTSIRKLRRRTMSHAFFNCMLRKEMSRLVPTRDHLIKGNPEEIFLWFSALPKDGEFADLVDEAVDRMRELKLR